MPAALLLATLLAAAFPPPALDPPSSNPQTIVLAGGCFWGVEAVFDHLKGVQSAVSGYSGGQKSTAKYDAVSTGTTRHAESVQITYDPSEISLGQILQVFFSVAHDPTQRGGQGPDLGSQYRSVIFYSSEDQKRIAAAYIAQLNRAKIFSQPITTELMPLTAFYPAEPAHQHFVERNPNYAYVVHWDLPKLKVLEHQYPQLWTTR